MRASYEARAVGLLTVNDFMNHFLEQPSGNSTSLRRLAMVLLTLVLASSVSGCSLFVMAGKAVFGDPKVTSAFTAATGTDLREADEPVVIICSAPHHLLAENPSLQIDIVDRVSRTLETQGIRVVDSGELASWYDDHGEWGDYSELASAFDAGFVFHIDLRQFDYRVPESENLLQGKAEGHLSVHQIMTEKKPALGLSKPRKDFVPVLPVFDRDFALQFPKSYPVPRETRSEDMFAQSFVDRTALHIAQHLYDYKTSESVH